MRDAPTSLSGARLNDTCSICGAYPCDLLRHYDLRGNERNHLIRTLREVKEALEADSEEPISGRVAVAIINKALDKEKWA